MWMHIFKQTESGVEVLLSWNVRFREFQTQNIISNKSFELYVKNENSSSLSCHYGEV